MEAVRSAGPAVLFLPDRHCVHKQVPVILAFLISIVSEFNRQLSLAGLALGRQFVILLVVIGQQRFHSDRLTVKRHFEFGPLAEGPVARSPDGDHVLAIGGQLYGRLTAPAV